MRTVCRSKNAAVVQDNHNSAASSGNSDEASGLRAWGQQRCQDPHTQAVSMLDAGDELHAHITCTDADNNDNVQIDDLASLLAQRFLGPCYTSVTIYWPRK